MRSIELQAPSVTVGIGEARRRESVVFAGIVVGVECRRWVGGPVLEVHLRDQTGVVDLVFFGRRAIGGVVQGAFLTAAGTVGRHAGERVILNPCYWLGPRPAEPAGVELPASAGAGAAIGRPVHA
jgi:hypothetical protein